MCVAQVLTSHKFILLLAVIGQILIARPDAVSGQETVEIVFTQGMSLRTLAQQYFGNPDEWQLLLTLNGFRQLEDLPPNARLTIPVALFQRTVQAIEQAAQTTRFANMEGAAVLSKTLIEQAEHGQKDALDLKNQGKLAEAEKAARNALQFAENALAEAKQKKVQDVSAVLAYKENRVQSRKPQQPVWNDALVTQELIKQERVRTLLESRAGILFVDGSQIQLNAESLVVIGEMKENLIKKTFAADVEVLEGDILAHLSALGGQKTFNITTPGVTTTVRSTKFRTSRDDQQVTRIANYDGEIDVEARQKKVTLKKDEGTRIEQNKPPEDPRKLLPPPEMVSPSATAPVFLTPIIHLEWKPLAQAQWYYLEISAERDFVPLLEAIRLRDTYYEWQAPGKGIYYYRLYTMDRDELAGPFSEPDGFYVDTDVTPPYLSIITPIDGETVFTPESIVRGTVEPQATLTINATPVEPDQNGLFAYHLPLTPGAQRITITATDPAGNTTTLERNVICNLDEQLLTLDIPARLMTNQTHITITGQRKPQTRIEIDGKSVELPEHFVHIVTLPEGEHRVEFKAISPTGQEQTFPILITIDLTPPVITLDKFPAYTRESTLTVSGQVNEEATLRLNGQAVPLDALRFAVPLTLREGENMLHVEAVDATGNTTTQTSRISVDTTPPDILQQTVSASETKGGEIVACQIQARDRGIGLAKTGSFSLVVMPGIHEFQGILTFNRDREAFEGNVFIPPNIKGKISIRDIRIQDRLGNETRNFY